MKNVTGRCLCGEIEVMIKEYGDFIYVCHCSMCRRQGSGPTHACDPGTSENFEISKGQDFLSLYCSSEDVERGFCKNCGTKLFWHSLSDDHYCVNVELFDEILAEGKLQLELFYNNKPAYYDFAQETKKLDENFQEIFL
ncbi:MAG: GFA family protein [Streptococcaceae bacterium]|jgi:hypothetical protein|nr:GFA family protein [Streptococcaceae bacterium]